MRYQFVDCRWELGNPGRGRELYLAGHIPGASFLDVDEDLAAPPGPGGRHPLPDAGVVRSGRLPRRDRSGRLRDRLREHGRRRAALVAPAPLRPRRLRGARPRGLARPAAGRRRGDRSRPRSRREPRSDDTIEADELAARLEELVVVDARLPARFRGEPNPIDRVPGRVPGAVNAPWNAPLPELPGGELVAYCGSGVTACVTCIGSPSPDATRSSTRAPGASGSSSTCPSSAASPARTSP